MSQPPSAQHCHLHPDREAYISCQRCGRPICPACMNEASVGFQCPECLAKGSRAVRQPRTVAGGAVQMSPGIASRVLIGVNVVVFVLTGVFGVTALETWGAMIGERAIFRGELIEGVAGGEYWRLLTSAFLHAGWLHLAFNMFALFLFGPFVEQILGTARFVAFYLLTALFSGAVVYLLTDPYTVTVGASGAVFGLFGFAFVALVNARQDVRTLIVLLAINAVLSLRDGVSWQGHLGGFIAGVILGLAVVLPARSRRTVAQTTAAAGLVAVAMVVVVLRTAALG